MMNSVPIRVSPGPGSLSILMTMSVLVLPTTTILGAAIGLFLPLTDIYFKNNSPYTTTPFNVAPINTTVYGFQVLTGARVLSTAYGTTSSSLFIWPPFPGFN
ncbi:hypothetical protein ES708_32908 [subsurface metagenome]